MLTNNKKIKLCFVFDSLNYGGAVKLSLELIKLLIGDNFEVTIVSLNNKPEIKDIFHNILPEVKLHIININNMKFIQRIRSLKKIYHENDIILSCLENANFYTGIVSLILRSKLYVSSVHGRDGVFIKDEKLQEMFRKKEYRNYRLYVKYVQSLLFRNFDLIFASSKDSKIFLENVRRIKNSKIKMYYFGYNYSELDQQITKEELINLKNRLNICDDDYIIGYIGRITYGKGLENSLKEITELIKENRKIKYILVGGGELIQELTEIIKDAAVTENVIITGYVDNIYPYYKIFNLFLLPSMSEGIPMVVEEAMYLEVPVLSSDAGGLPEIVINKLTGLTFKKGDYKSMKNLLVELIEKRIDTANLIKNAKVNVLQNFNIKNNYKYISEELINLYKNR